MLRCRQLIARRRFGSGLWEEDLAPAAVKADQRSTGTVTRETLGSALKEDHATAMTNNMINALQSNQAAALIELEDLALEKKMHESILQTAMKAAEIANLPALRRLLPKVVDLERRIGADTLVRCAVKSGEPEVLDTVLAAGADLHRNNPFGTAMIYKRFDKMLPYLKKLGVQDMSPLGIALRNDDMDGIMKAVRRRGNAISMVRQVMAHACRENNLQQAQWAMDHLPDFSLIDASRAARYNSPDVLKLVLEKVDVSQSPINRSSPLFPAVMHRHHECAKLLLDAGINVRSDAEGMFLTQAKANNDAQMVQLLEDAGASIKRVTLVAAVRLDNFEMFAKTLEGDVGEKDLHGAIMLVVLLQRPTMTKLLLEKYPELASHTKDDKGRTILYRAVTSGNNIIVRLLLEAGADPNEGDPLMQARRTKQTDIFRSLQEFGALDRSEVAVAVRNSDFDVLARKPANAVMRCAVAEERCSVLEWLLKRRAVDPRNMLEFALIHCKSQEALVALKYLPDSELNELKVDRSTLLVMAVRNGLSDVVREMLARGADPNKENPPGKMFERPMSPLAVAKTRKHPLICEMLLRYGAEADDPLERAVHAGRISEARTLLSDVPAGQARSNALASSVRANELEMCKTLLASGEAPEAALVLAAIHNRPDVVDLVLEQNLSLRDARGREGDTVLMIACKHGNSEAALKLLEHGADPNIGDPIRIMRHRGDGEMCRTLSRFGASNSDPVVRAVESNNLDDLRKSLDECRRKGDIQEGLLLKRALKTCCRKDRRDIAKWLLENGADGFEAMFTSAVHNNVAIAEMILDACPYVDVDMPSKSRCESLMLFATRKEHQEFMEFLHARGADLELSNPLQVARVKKHMIPQKLLEDWGASPMEAVVANAWRHNDLEAVRSGVDVQSKSQMRHNLRVATSRSNIDMVKWLLDQGADPLWAINTAIAAQNVDVLFMLLDAAPSDYEQRISREPVLATFARMDDPKRTQELIERGMDPFAADLPRVLERNGMVRMQKFLSNTLAEKKA